MFFELFKKTTEEKTSDSFTTDTITNSISKFIYNPDEGITFHIYYRRYKGIFKKDCSYWNDKKILRLLLRKLSPTEHKKYINLILPKQPSEINFEETTGILTKNFGD